MLLKVMALVAGMLAGADSIDDMNLLCHGGMGSLFERQGKTGSPKGAARIVGDALAALRLTSPPGGSRPLLRADSAFYGHTTIGTALKQPLC